MSKVNEILTDEVINYFKDIASQIMGDDPEEGIVCTFCRQKIPDWEAIAVANIFLGGIPAHLSCPQDGFMQNIHELGIEKGFDYFSFSNNIDKIVENSGVISTDLVSGVVNI
ncbi:MAG: hypothetical protein PF689_07900 [Deltaproteobacteria bacterium]|nr:hypothetical protein [Deltaproteobacteria bacterium]